jgi:hypothetical protein
MNDQTTTPAATGGHAHERCLCCELVGTLQTVLGVSPVVKQHLSNSRVEFLKAVRAMIDSRIEHLSGAGQDGTKISVE